MKYLTTVFIICFVLLFANLSFSDNKVIIERDIDEYFHYIAKVIAFEQITIWDIAEFTGLPFGFNESADSSFEYLILPQNRYGLKLEIIISKDNPRVILMAYGDKDEKGGFFTRISMDDVQKVTFYTRFFEDGNLKKIRHKNIFFERSDGGIIQISNFNDWRITFVGFIAQK